MKNEKFDKAKYDNNYRKTHKKQFNIDLNIDEYEELEELLKKYNLTKVNFVRKSMKILKEDNMKFVDDLGIRNLKEYVNDRIKYYDDEDYKEYNIDDNNDLYKIACDYLDDKLYSQNLTNGCSIKYSARDALLIDFKYNLVDIFKIENIDEIGLIEFIVDGNYDIIKNSDGTITLDTSNY